MGASRCPRRFWNAWPSMAPKIGTGLGLTESAGFCTYTPLDAGVDEVLASIGHDMPVYRMSIRQPMQRGRAGGSAPAGWRGRAHLLSGTADVSGLRRRCPGDGADGFARRLALHRRHRIPAGRRAALLRPRQLDHQARRPPGVPGGCREPYLRPGGQGGRLRGGRGRAPAAIRSDCGFCGEEARRGTHRRGTAPARQGHGVFHAPAALRHSGAGPDAPEPGREERLPSACASWRRRPRTSSVGGPGCKPRQRVLVSQW